MRSRLIGIMAACFLTAALALVGYLLILMAGDYVLDEKKLVMNSSSVLVDEEGRVIKKLFVENRDLVDLKEVPKDVQEAFISVEDARFYEHHGIDARAILRALYKDILAGEKVEGGSTITQQLAKNVFLTKEKSWLRKTKEVIIAINLEKKYSKKKLLEMYLNQIYFGHGAYGIETASKLYFNKEVSELTAEQGALLAALPKSPAYYSPILHPERSKERRDLVIGLMEQQGYLDPDEAVRLQGKTLSLDVQPLIDDPSLLSYVDMVLEEAEKKYNLSNDEVLRGGYKITVPLNIEVQKKAYELFQDGSYFKGTDCQVQGAFVLIDNKTGGVISSIGGRDYVQKGINRVTVRKQPGSTIKPLAVYAPAMDEKKFKPYSLLRDEYASYDGYSPRNYNGIYIGRMSMYDAVLQSANAPAVWALDTIGVDTAKSYLEKAGIKLEDKGLAIALGGLSEGISPLELAKAYRSFPEKGIVTEPYFITKIADRSKKVIGQARPGETKVFSAQTAWNMTRMLEGVASEGTGKAGGQVSGVAGKTGTTALEGVDKGVKDAWFAGFTPKVTGAVWMGYDAPGPKRYLIEGSAQPTRLFKDIIKASGLDDPKGFQKPKGVKELASPIRLEPVEGAEARLELKPLGLFTASLEWNPPHDKRVVYHIYEKKEDEEKFRKIGTVKGKGKYEVEFINLFSIPSYKIVPYNIQTKQEGEPSSVLTPVLE